MKTEPCRSCGAPIIWARHMKSKKWMPLDEKMHEKGANRYRVADVAGVPTAYGVTTVSGHRSHFSTCPDRKKWRKEESKQESLL